MKRRSLPLLLTLLALLPAAAAAGQFGSLGGAAGKASIDLTWQDAPVAGSEAMLGVVVDIEPRWHVQAGEGSGDEQPPYLATTLTVSLPDGWTAGTTKWPAAHTFDLGVGKYAEKLAGYEGRIVLAVPVAIPADAAAGPHEVSVVLGYQACDDRVCVMPTDTRAKTTVTLGTTGGAAPDVAALFVATLGDAGTDAPDGAETHADQGDFASGERLRAEIAWYEDRLEPGASAHLGVILDVAPGWHVQAGVGVPEDLIPTTVELMLPDGWSASGDIRWPQGEAFTIGEPPYAIDGIGYGGRVLVIVPVKVAESAAPGDYTVSAKVGYQACDDAVCEMPTDIVARGEATVVAAGAPVVPRPRDRAVLRLFQDALGPAAAPADGGAEGSPIAFGGGLIGMLLGALIGGFLLNLTPCVLPVIPLKIMSLAHTAGNRGRTLALGIVMSIGVVAFWLGLGVAIVSVSQFTSANQLFQYPAFSIGVGVVIAVLSIGMCGLFTLQLPRFVYQISPSQDSFLGSFGFGIMTAILSTPCTAPFMGGAAAAAVSQTPATVMTVFAAIGAGMASPYLVLAAFPQLVDRMPRSGPGSELVKQVLGLFMLAAAAYFIGVGVSGWLATPPEPPSRAYWWPVFGFSAAAAGWMAYRTMQITPSGARRAVFGGLGMIGVAASMYGAVRFSQPDKTIDWVYYTPAAFEQALADGDAVVLEFTAEWCLNCKLLERSVLNSRNVADRLAEDDVVAMKVDLTGNNTIGNAKLEESGSVTIPWLVVYTPAGEPVFAQNWYSPEMLLEGIDAAVNGTTIARK